MTETRPVRRRIKAVVKPSRPPIVAPWSFRFDVPTLPPSLNNVYVNKRSGGRYMKTTAIAWKQGVAHIIRVAAAAANISPDAKTPWSFSLMLWSKKTWTYDVSNRVKVLEDTISDALGLDDRYVVVYTCAKFYGPEHLTCFVQSGYETVNLTPLETLAEDHA